MEKEALLAFEKTIRDKRTYRRYRCVWLKEVEGKTAVEIAHQEGYHWRHVQRIWAQVSQGGLESLRSAYKGGGRQLLATERESVILTRHQGDVGIVGVTASLSEAVGRPVKPGTVYGLLKRHGWKPKRPRPQHPKADAEAQRIFKKAGGRD